MASYQQWRRAIITPQINNNLLPADFIKWSGYYIIAPENGCADSITPSQWEEVYQYGSNLGIGGSQEDPKWEQDGIAPQCAVTNISNGTNPKSGRVFIPKTYANGKSIPKDFAQSHMIANYGWILERPVGSLGYVTKK